MPKKNGKNLSCVICGNTFYAAKKQVEKGRKYCGQKCYWEYFKLNPLKYWTGKKRPEMSGENNPMKSIKMRKLMSKKMTGKKLSDEHKRKISESKIGKHTGEDHPNWKGGKAINCGRTMLLSENHPNKHHGNYVYESRLVMERHLGRILKKEEVVHHINLDKSDNRIENLMLFKNNSSHTKYHWYLKNK